MERKVLLLSCSNMEYDGRLRELIKLAKNIGNVTCVTTDSSIRRDVGGKNNHYIFIYKGIKDYIKFILYCVNIARKIKHLDVVISDNRKAILPSMVIKYSFKPKLLVLDARELYILNETKSMSGKIGCIFEKIFNKHFDLILVANKERGEYMYKYYQLQTPPLIFPNIRKLTYDVNFKEKEYIEKYKNEFKSKWKIVVTDGCALDRGIVKLLDAMNILGNDYSLYIIGKSKKNYLRYIKEYINENQINNVRILGLVNQNELKWIINQCDIGVAIYNQNDINNKYCASGKIYEFIYEGIPLLTSTNPPLKAFCAKYKVGISTDNYIDGIRMIIKDYNIYKQNIKYFCDDIYYYIKTIETVIEKRLLEAK